MVNVTYLSMFASQDLVLLANVGSSAGFSVASTAAGVLPFALGPLGALSLRPKTTAMAGPAAPAKVRETSRDVLRSSNFPHVNAGKDVRVGEGEETCKMSMVL